MEITRNLVSDSERRTPPDTFSFGKAFTDHMFVQDYDVEVGWSEARIEPYGDFSLAPSTSVFHYGQEIFEGTKAYRRPDGNVNLFRPWENMKRFNHSAERMRMATVDPEEHLEALVELIKLDHEWVPDKEGSSLYIRPFMIATQQYLGVTASTNYRHAIILSPVGAYFAEGFNPIPVYVSDQYIRAVRGGTGEAKCGGNYAASLYVSEEVKAMGYSQVLWLDGVERRYVEEVGAMNIAFVYEGNRVVTPELSGSILPGITRDSVLKLAPDLGFKTEEARIDINDVMTDLKSGKITEVFGMGTAAVIAPVGKLGYKDDEVIINDNESGPVASKLYQSLTDIQYGRVDDPYGWTLTIEC